MDVSIKQRLLRYIKDKYKPNQPIIQKDLYKQFENINPVTIRQTLLRLTEDQLLIKSDTTKGTFFIPDQNRILDVNTFDFNNFLEQKYLFDNSGKRIGYISGFQTANKLGLTSQTSNVYTIMSNAVSEKKRRIKAGNRRIIINRSRVEVNDLNYKFLQVLDLISEHEKYFDYSMEKNLEIFEYYLSELLLDKNEIDVILSKYPLKTQLNFYKMEVDHVITRR